MCVLSCQCGRKCRTWKQGQYQRQYLIYTLLAGKEDTQETRFPLPMKKKKKKKTTKEKIRKRGLDKVLKEKVIKFKAYLMLIHSYCKPSNEKLELQLLGVASSMTLSKSYNICAFPLQFIKYNSNEKNSFLDKDSIKFSV